MNDNHEASTTKEVEEARLTAYALGQLMAGEQAAAEAVMARSEQARQFVEETAALAAHVKQAHQQAPSPQTSASLREAIEKRIDATPEGELPAAEKATPIARKRCRPLLWLAGMASCLLIAVALYLSAGPQSPRGVARVYPPAVAQESGNYAKSSLDLGSKEEAATASSSPTPRKNSEEKPNAGHIVGAAELPAMGSGGMMGPGGMPPGGAPGMPGGGMMPPGGALPEFGYVPGGAAPGTRGLRREMPSTPIDATPDEPPILYPDAEVWQELTARRKERCTSAPNYMYDDVRYTVSKPAWEQNGEQYDHRDDNRFRSVAEQPQSTFSIDVDTASYANVRRFLTEGRLPPPDAVRIEEMVNYFPYDYSPPTGETPFVVHLETAQCPWQPEHRLLRIGLKGRQIDRQQRGPSNIVFLLDVLGSMDEPDKLPLVKQAMRMLVEQLQEDDRVAIVTYASGTDLRLPSARGNERRRIMAAIESLRAEGSTYGSAGIELAYRQADASFVSGGVNRIILCTDGDLNVGVTSDDDLVKLIQKKAKSGVFLTVLGFGTGNLKDGKLEKLADKGHGVYAYIDSLREAHRVLVEQMTGHLVTIAKDVKIQIEFNPAEVAAYRLIGYENRVMANRDFNNDRKQAGDIGAGHTVTALYELVPANADEMAKGEKPPLKYQRVPEKNLTEQARSGELLTVRLRYKEPEGKESRLQERTAKDSGTRFGQASTDFRFASAVAAFGMVLRNSPHRGQATLAAAEEYAAGALGKDPNGHRAEFIDLVRRARSLSRER